MSQKIIKLVYFVGFVNILKIKFNKILGEIGDCWFLSALSTLAENEFFLQKVIPAGQGFTKNYHGIFRFRFYRFGEWEEIVIDDRLPTRLFLKLFYSSDLQRFFNESRDE